MRALQLIPAFRQDVKREIEEEHEGVKGGETK